MTARIESAWPRWSDLDAVEQERLLNRKRKPRARLPASLSQYMFLSYCQTHLLLQQLSRR